MTVPASPAQAVPASASGLLLVDKPRGVTSFDAVAAVRSALRTRKVGHAGTLDPMATGLLVIGFGHATRLLAAIVGHDKTYEATIRLGQATTTDDAEGTVLPAGAVRPEEGAGAAAATADRVAALDRSAVEATIAAHFLGRIDQVPNAYSAIKVGGRRAYDLARDGEDVELKARPVTVSAFDVLAVRRGLASAGVPGWGTAVAGMAPVLDVDVRVSCSSGTYIRALARDLGAELGVGGHLVRLRRTRVGRFALPDDTSGRVPPASDMPDLAGHVVTAHVGERSFVARDGRTVTRPLCLLDVPGGLDGAARGDWLRSRALTMAQAARGAMTVLPIGPDDAAELRFGRRIDCAWPQGVDTAAALVPATGDVVALVAPARGCTQARPVTVFPAQ